MLGRLSAFMATIAIIAPLMAADPKPRSDAYPALKKEFQEAVKKYAEEQQKEAKAAFDKMKERVAVAEKELKDAKTEEQTKIAKEKLKEAQTMPAQKMSDPTAGPGKEFAPKFFEFATKNPDDPSACDALLMTLRTCYANMGKNPEMVAKVVDELMKRHAKKPEIKGCIRELTSYLEPAGEKLVEEVTKNHPDRKIRAQCILIVADSKENAAQIGEIVKSQPEARKQISQILKPEAADKLVNNIQKNKDEAAKLKKIVEDQYSDVIPNLSIGKTAPEIVSKDLNGKVTKLSELRGRVVVLDIWATWCGPCRAMIPHEREMVGKLKDKPFTLVSVSADSELETIKEFVKTTEMPWTHWWNGAEGGILEDWNVRYFPTIYILDSKGVIRHKDLRGPKMEEAVEELLKEMETKK